MALIPIWCSKYIIFKSLFFNIKFRNQEFSRVGYYVNNEYEEIELRENPPTEPQFNKLVRTILSDQPRVTKFKIDWECNLNKEENLSKTKENDKNSVQNEDQKASASLVDEQFQKMEIDNMLLNSKPQLGETFENSFFENKENLSDSRTNNQNEHQSENFKQNDSKID